MLDDRERSILRFAILSRIVVTLLAIATYAIIEPFDTSSHLLFEPFAFNRHLKFLQAFVSWDGAHFLHIAQNGYTYEHSHAFFPLYPLTVRLLRYSSSNVQLSRVITQLCSNVFINVSSGVDEEHQYPEIYVLCGWFIRSVWCVLEIQRPESIHASNGAFVLAAIFLYRLGILVFENLKVKSQDAERIARTGAYLFCITPSSVFMSSLYSESMMCFFSFGGFYCIEKHKELIKEQKRTKKRISQYSAHLSACAILFGCGSVTRSNGILLSLYLVWHRLRTSPHWTNFATFCRYWLVTALLMILAVGPQLVYFVCGIWKYCPSFHTVFDHTRKSEYPFHDRPWCHSAFLNYSAMYMFIQREYWNVGLFRYYQWKQIPNFFLASPVVSLSVLALYRFFRKQLIFTTSWTCEMNVYCIHWAFLLINGLLVVHVQVITRLLCACPPFYWIPAIILFQPKKSESVIQNAFFKIVVGYFVLYTLLGSILFSSFYPWT
uniref:GPI mannosyltransferase 2 n=1 Tax=Albugo laibachii Nc14 TaxID=890382 RepID=F0WC77_9STRA|nr:GPI mannosyltransferase putative [Albugo laibachii Nc14]|eukprot:CCA18790.1 GPI mannosyltransferase putative [Albugo laibachii Nc14]